MGLDGRGLSAGVGRCVASGQIIGDWVAARLGTVYDPHGPDAIGLRQGETVLAGVIYENWNGASIMAHIAVAGPLTRRFLFAVFHYPFEVCGVRKIICPVPASNSRSRRLAEHMGFSVEATLADAHPDGDLLLYTLTKSACRFLGWASAPQSGT